jgi:hypothetical protein
MVFIAIGALTLIAVCLLNFRRAVEERTIRWKLYAQRDRLRRLAADNRALLHEEAFVRIDRAISIQCGSLPNVSVWSLLPVLAFDNTHTEEMQRAFAEELGKPINREITQLFDESISLMIKHLLWRHMFITMLAGVTIVGAIALYGAAKWASERIVSGSIEPVMPIEVGSVATAA